MYKQIKNSLSFLLLCLFLFPAVEREVHAYEHQNDIHCASTDKHFHEEEHNCSICDFTITDSTSPTPLPFCSITISKDFCFNSYNEQVYFSKAYQHLPSRAPPLA